MLSNFENKTRITVGNFQSVKNRRKIVLELDVDNSSDDLGNLTVSDGCSLGRESAGN